MVSRVVAVAVAMAMAAMVGVMMVAVVTAAVAVARVRAVAAVPSRKVRRLRRRSHPRLIWSAHQPAILSSNAEGNRS